VDTALRAHSNDLNVKTVAAIIFPAGLYKRHGRQGMYEAYKRIMARAMVDHTWGTYALRMIAWRPSKGAATINQLDATILKLDRAAHQGHPYKSAYEVGVTDPGADDASDEFGCEAPTFHPGSEGRKIGNMPCLSHLSFKLINPQTVDLTGAVTLDFDAARFPIIELPMCAGCCLIFSERTMHGSGPNASQCRRLAVNARYTRADTLVYPMRLRGETIDGSNLDIRAHRCVLAARCSLHPDNLLIPPHD
jgi:hypothetical protein